VASAGPSEAWRRRRASDDAGGVRPDEIVIGGCATRPVFEERAAPISAEASDPDQGGSGLRRVIGETVARRIAPS